MSLRAKFILYLVVIHFVFAAVSFVLLLDHRIWLLAIEAFFVLSFLAGAILTRQLFEPIKLIRSGVEFMKASDFSTRFREVNQPDLDPLIEVYNQMADSLREERIRSEEQEHFLQRIISASPSGIVTLDLDGRITMANSSAAALFGMEQEEILGRRLDELKSQLAVQIASLATHETRMLTLQGHRRVKCQALHFMDRGFARQFILMDELTEELRRSEKAAYEKLIRLISHEVTNTSSAVGSLMESCLNYSGQIDERDRNDFAEALSVAISRTNRMNKFIQQYAEVVRLPAPTIERCNISHLLDEVSRLLKDESERRRVAWLWDKGADLPHVDLDPIQMEQVLINICKNALEAIGAEGTITVHIDMEEGRPVLRIKDTGGGIPPEVQDHIFTPFYSTKKDGQGIGLTLVREVLLRHGFEYSLENVDRGAAEFSIFF